MLGDLYPAPNQIYPQIGISMKKIALPKHFPLLFALAMGLVKALRDLISGGISGVDLFGVALVFTFCLVGMWLWLRLRELLKSENSKDVA